MLEFLEKWEKFWKTARWILLVSLPVWTVLFFCDIKFVMFGKNIIEWDILIGVGWVFCRLCRWAGREHTGRRALVVAVLAFVVIFAGLCALVSSVFGSPLYGKVLSYVEETEPQTHRTFVAEYYRNLFNRGVVKLYEHFGPVILACDTEKYVGEFLNADPGDSRAYLSEDGQEIVISMFFMEPIFAVPAT